MTATEPLYVQVGCGQCAPEGWLNFDASPTLRAERLPLFGRFIRRNAHRFAANVRFGNIVRGLPIPDQSCAGIYASHVLEHLALDECRTALAHCHRYLQPGGILRVVMPDLEWVVDQYLKRKTAEPALAASGFMHDSVLGDETRPRHFGKRLVEAYGNARHRWLWDYAAFAEALTQAGFTRIRRCEFDDCDDPHFRAVEDSARFQDALAVECRR